MMMKLTPPRVFAGIACALVAAAVIAGLFAAGSPLTQRRHKLDAERINNLMQISSGMDSYYQSKRVLASSLEELRRDPLSSYVQTIADPKTGAPYDYRIATDSSYELCATFDLPTDTASTDPNSRAMVAPASAPYAAPGGKIPPSSEPAFWDHPAGRHCFTLDERDRLPNLPTKGSTASCALMRQRGTGKIACFGCANGVCTDPAANFEPYALRPDAVGIPYSCYESPQGCALAQ